MLFAISVCHYAHSSLGVAEQITLWLHREATNIHKSVGCVDIMISDPQSLSLILLQGGRWSKLLRPPILDRHCTEHFFGTQSYL